ncbi:MAG TPA: DUF488 domain-containing protein [Pyrinomonadaceae bacterium]|jgi:uncharacterized protein (DUF488 family)
MRIYTLGYEGLGLEAYVDILRAFNVGVVLDVREKAWSQRPEFIKSKMDHGLAMAGIDYIHVQSAGNPSAIRKNVFTADECLRRYREHIKGKPGCVSELHALVKSASEADRPACLTCYERNPQHCHRSVLIDALIEMDVSVEPVHLPLTAPINHRRQKTTQEGSLLKTAFLFPDFLPTT